MRKPAIQTAPLFADRRVLRIATVSSAKATLAIMGDIGAEEDHGQHSDTLENGGGNEGHL